MHTGRVRDSPRERRILIVNTAIAGLGVLGLGFRGNLSNLLEHHHPKPTPRRACPRVP